MVLCLTFSHGSYIALCKMKTNKTSFFFLFFFLKQLAVFAPQTQRAVIRVSEMFLRNGLIIIAEHNCVRGGYSFLIIILVPRQDPTGSL